MTRLEAKIRQALANNGIRCSSVYQMPDPDETRVLLAFSSKSNRRLSTVKIEKALSTTDLRDFRVPKDFQRLSSAFLHLEITLGARTEPCVTPDAT
jgi:hypothetical protein